MSHFSRLALPLALLLGWVHTGVGQTPGEAAPAPAFELEDDWDEGTTTVSDPLEPLNRAMFAFNDKAYAWVFRPVSKGYVAVTPKPVRKGIGNFFRNLRYPIRGINSLLQGKFDRFGKESAAFIINSTAGIGGLLNVSGSIEGLNAIPHEDTGQTLGVWGLSEGPFLVLPLIGPTTLRGGVGTVGDYLIHPLRYFERKDYWEWEYTWGIRITRGLNEMPDTLERYDRIQEMAVDPYSATRDAYLQNQRMEVER